MVPATCSDQSTVLHQAYEQLTLTANDSFMSSTVCSMKGLLVMMPAAAMLVNSASIRLSFDVVMLPAINRTEFLRRTVDRLFQFCMVSNVRSVSGKRAFNLIANHLPVIFRLHIITRELLKLRVRLVVNIDGHNIRTSLSYGLGKAQPKPPAGSCYDHCLIGEQELLEHRGPRLRGNKTSHCDRSFLFEFAVEKSLTFVMPHPSNMKDDKLTQSNRNAPPYAMEFMLRRALSNPSDSGFGLRGLRNSLNRYLAYQHPRAGTSCKRPS